MLVRLKKYAKNTWSYSTHALATVVSATKGLITAANLTDLIFVYSNQPQYRPNQIKENAEEGNYFEMITPIALTTLFFICCWYMKYAQTQLVNDDDDTPQINRAWKYFNFFARLTPGLVFTAADVMLCVRPTTILPLWLACTVNVIGLPTLLKQDFFQTLGIIPEKYQPYAISKALRMYDQIREMKYGVALETIDIGAAIYRISCGCISLYGQTSSLALSIIAASGVVPKLTNYKFKNTAPNDLTNIEKLLTLPLATFFTLCYSGADGSGYVFAFNKITAIDNRYFPYEIIPTILLEFFCYIEKTYLGIAPVTRVATNTAGVVWQKAAPAAVLDTLSRLKLFPSVSARENHSDDEELRLDQQYRNEMSYNSLS